MDVIAADRDTAQLLPASVQDDLPEWHLPRFVAEVVGGLHKVQNAWALVCLAWNSKRMAVMRLQ